MARRNQTALAIAIVLVAVFILARGACEPASDEAGNSSQGKPAFRPTDLTPPVATAPVATSSPAAVSSEEAPIASSRPVVRGDAPPPKETLATGGVGRLRGTVTDAKGAPNPNARVRFSPAHVGIVAFDVDADPEGRYVASVERSSWHVTASAPGLVPCSEDTAIHPGDDKTLDALVLLPAARLVATLVDAEGGGTIDGTVVASWRSNGTHDAVQRTRGGSATFDLVPKGELHVEGHARGYAAAGTDVVIAGDAGQAVVPLRAASRLTGFVTTAAREPVGGASVRLMSEGRCVGYGTTDGDGGYLLGGLPACRGTLVVQGASPPLAAAVEVVIARSSEQRADVIAGPAGKVTLHVRNGEDELDDAECTATRKDSRETTESYLPAGFESLAPGEYTIRVIHAGFEVAVKEGVKVAAGENEVAIETVPLGSIRGTVTGVEGKQGEVVLQALGEANPGGLMSDRFGKDGGFAFGRLPAGTYRLRAVAVDAAHLTDGDGDPDKRPTFAALATVELTARGEASASLHLEPAAVATLALRSAEGPLPPNVEVKLFHETGPPFVETATDRRGHCGLVPLPPGPYVVEVRGKRTRIVLAAGASPQAVTLDPR